MLVSTTLTVGSTAFKPVVIECMCILPTWKTMYRLRDDWHCCVFSCLSLSSLLELAWVRYICAAGTYPSMDARSVLYITWLRRDVMTVILQDHVIRFPRPSPSVLAYCKRSNTEGVEDWEWG